MLRFTKLADFKEKMIHKYCTFKIPQKGTKKQQQQQNTHIIQNIHIIQIQEYEFLRFAQGNTV